MMNQKKRSHFANALKTDNPMPPISATELDKLGWDRVDFLLVSGDAYVDHPSFGSAIVARWIQKLGFRVAVVAQPDWKNKQALMQFGRPRLAVLVSAGNMDSMLNNYVTKGKKRRTDSYSPNGKAGMRPDRATLVYCNLVRELWGDIPLIIGGIEASLRRMAHYDFWSDSVRRSILVDSRADLLVYGMAEKALQEICLRLANGESITTFNDIRGTCWKTHSKSELERTVLLPSYKDVTEDKKKFAEAYRLFYLEQSPTGRAVSQDQGSWIVIQNQPSEPLSKSELDEIYALPFMRTAHSLYGETQIPAIEEVSLSIVSHRGCMGECSFCALSSHQGRIIQKRSAESVYQEALIISKSPKFKGYIHDVGGPTANFREATCTLQKSGTQCRDRSCMQPTICKKMHVSHRDYLALLRRIRAIPGVKKVFIRSGIRYDYILSDPEREKFVKELCLHHVSGQLKIAPEHVSSEALKHMNKPGVDAYLKFVKLFESMNQMVGKKQYVVPYFMCGHPGTTLTDSILLAEFMRDKNIRPEQVQSFTPTPGTRSTCMYFTGIDPLTGEAVHVPSPKEMRMQRALLQYWLPENQSDVCDALRLAGREDLIGHSKNCLIKPKGTFQKKYSKKIN